MGEINIVEAVSTLGFPIALCLVLVVFIYKIYNQSVVREEKLMEQIEEYRKVNESAIKTISHFAEKLDIMQTDIHDIKSDLATIKAKA